MEVVKAMVTLNLRTGAKHPMMVGLMAISNMAVSWNIMIVIFHHSRVANPLEAMEVPDLHSPIDHIVTTVQGTEEVDHHIATTKVVTATGQDLAMIDLMAITDRRTTDLHMATIVLMIARRTAIADRRTIDLRTVILSLLTIDLHMAIINLLTAIQNLLTIDRRTAIPNLRTIDRHMETANHLTIDRHTATANHLTTDRHTATANRHSTDRRTAILNRLTTDRHMETVSRHMKVAKEVMVAADRHTKATDQTRHMETSQEDMDPRVLRIPVQVCK